MSTLRSNAARLAAVCAFALLSACSSDPNAASIAGPDGAIAPRFDVTPTPNLVIIPVGDPGAFTNAVAPNNSGRLNTEFWDNLSSDGPPCNMGFFATGAVGADCASERGNSDANAGGGYTRYFGDGPSDRDAAGFMFNGDYTYTVTLQGSYTAGAANTTTGYFTKNLDGTYNLFPVASWTSVAGVGTSTVINTGGADWGFYINYTASPDNTGCVSPTVHCSDATGGFTGAPFQHFALMLNPTTSTYLVGAEDNRLGLFTAFGDPANPTNEDSDYNDYMWSVVPNMVPDQVCDFVTFGRLVTAVGGKKVVVSGNAGGNNADGSIKGEFHIEYNGVDYHVADIDTYGPVTSGVFLGLTNARVFTGTSKNGHAIELRLYDGGEPGKNKDRVYATIDGVPVLGAAGQFIDQGNMQYHANCHGPKD